VLTQGRRVLTGASDTTGIVLARVRVFAESQIKKSQQRRLCREPNKKLLVKKKYLAKRPLCRQPNKKQSVKKKHSAKKFFTEWNFFLALSKEILKIHLFTSNFFLSSTYTYTKLNLKFDTILTLFAIFNNFTSFLGIFSHTYDMNCKCMKLYSKVGEKMIFMFMRHL
jgi:hypothetical protein